MKNNALLIAWLIMLVPIIAAVVVTVKESPQYQEWAQKTMHP